jgi:hypothetical protein
MKDAAINKSTSPSSETQPSAEGGESGTINSSAGSQKGSIKDTKDQIVEFYIRVNFLYMLNLITCRRDRV